MSEFINEKDRDILQILNENNYVEYYFVNNLSDYRRIYRVQFPEKVDTDNFSTLEERTNKKLEDNNITSLKIDDYFFDLDKYPRSVYIIIEDQ